MQGTGINGKKIAHLHKRTFTKHSKVVCSAGKVQLNPKMHEISYCISRSKNFTGSPCLYVSFVQLLPSKAIGHTSDDCYLLQR